MITEGKSYTNSEDLGSSALVAQGDRNVEFTLENNANLSFSMDLNGPYSYPQPEGTSENLRVIGVTSLLATHGGTLKIVGQPEGGSTLTITTKTILITLRVRILGVTLQRSFLLCHLPEKIN